MKMILSLTLLTLSLVACTPAPLPPVTLPVEVVVPPPLNLTGLVQKCSASECSSAELAQISGGVVIDLPSTVTDGDTPQLKLSAYSGPAEWTLEGLGSLHLPVGGTALYLPPLEEAGSSGTFTLRARVGSLNFSKTVNLLKGSLRWPERSTVQQVNVFRSTVQNCLSGPSVGPSAPLVWNPILREVALEYGVALTQSIIVGPVPYFDAQGFALARARLRGFQAKALGASDWGDNSSDGDTLTRTPFLEKRWWELTNFANLRVLSVVDCPLELSFAVKFLSDPSFTDFAVGRLMDAQGVGQGFYYIAARR